MRWRCLRAKKSKLSKANARVSSKRGTRNGDVMLLNSVSCYLNDVCDDFDATDKLQELEGLPMTTSDVEFRSAESTITEPPTLSPHASSKKRRTIDGDD